MVLRMPVREGVPKRIYGLADALNSPAYATSVGLLQWASEDAGTTTNGHKPEIKLPNLPVEKFVGAAGRWIKTLIPK
jgi:cell division protein FtsA